MLNQMQLVLSFKRKLNQYEMKAYNFTRVPPETLFPYQQEFDDAYALSITIATIAAIAALEND